MKTVKRTGVFETNSSSTHTLVLMSSDAYEEDKKLEKPKFRKYSVLKNLKDKFFMACGCCKELFLVEEYKVNTFWDDEMKETFFRIKKFFENRKGGDISDCIDEEFKVSTSEDDGTEEEFLDIIGDICDYIYISSYYITYDMAIELLVEVYCEITGEDVEEVTKNVNKINNSGRACHMKFFQEGALYDEQGDYRVIMDLFDGTVNEVKQQIKNYLDDGTVLCYREFWNGMHWNDDDD